MPVRILSLAWLWLALAMAGCAHVDGMATTAEDLLPTPTDPAYPGAVLRARAEHVRAVERWEQSLDLLNWLIELRQGARIARDSSGKIVSLSEDTDLQLWRMEMETELLKARVALERLTRRVRADFQGEFPPWWPRDDG
jgi:hypothetical protein